MVFLSIKVEYLNGFGRQENKVNRGKIRLECAVLSNSRLAVRNIENKNQFLSRTLGLFIQKKKQKYY
jgi:hypothetical protein